MLYLLILSASIAFYFYLKWCSNYWKRRGLVAVDTTFNFKTSFQYLLGLRSLEEIFEYIYKAAPDAQYIAYYNMLSPALLIRDPELIHRITTKDFSHFHERFSISASSCGRLVHNLFLLQGEDWKQVRSKLNPTFSQNKLKRMFPLVEGSAVMLVNDHIRQKIQSSNVVEITDATTRFALDVIGKCAFGLKFNTLNESDSFFRDVGKCLNESGIVNAIRLSLLFVNARLMKYFGLKLTSDKVENFIFNFLHAAKDLRRSENQHRGDFLQLMLDLKDGKTDPATRLFTDELIAANVFAFYFAGHETSAIVLAFALYEIAIRPQIQEKLRREIREAAGDNSGKVLDFEHVVCMPYLNMVVSETLRLHSPFSFMVRLCTETYQIAGSSFEIKAGEQVMYSIGGIHRDEKYFPDPLVFDPERFTDANIARSHPYAYLPFGSGPRVCIGMRFALMEIKVALIHLLLNYKFSACEETEIPVPLKKGGFFHTPDHGIRLLVEDLENAG